MVVYLAVLVALFLAALDQRHAAFHALGCRLSDHGLAYLPDTDASAADAAAIFQRAWAGADITPADRERLAAWLLYEIGTMNHRRGWAQQFHLGAFRNTNTRMFRALGPDSGFDSMGDHRQGPGLVRLLDKLDTTDQLARTILYNNNPADNELLATMTGNYQDGRCPGKMQFGPAWWFLDQQDGIERHLNALSALGLLSRFVGMVTDSRSFLSYPRHEYFRRILCNLLGRDVENGMIPNDPALLGQLVENICYHNAVRYFGIDLPEGAGKNLPSTA